MNDLIAALQIFLKYENPDYPTCCSHDELRVCVDPSKVSAEDKTRLEELGFHADEEMGDFYSFKFGSA